MSSWMRTLGAVCPLPMDSIAVSNVLLHTKTSMNSNYQIMNNWSTRAREPDLCSYLSVCYIVHKKIAKNFFLFFSFFCVEQNKQTPTLLLPFFGAAFGQKGLAYGYAAVRPRNAAWHAV